MLLEGASTDDAYQRLKAVFRHITLLHGEDGPDAAIALGWHTVPGESNQRTDLGELEYRAKYQNDRAAAHELATQLSKAVSHHLTMSSSEIVMGFESSRSLAPVLARSVAADLGVDVVFCSKRDKSKSQKNVDDSATLDNLMLNLMDAFSIPELNGVTRVLIVDDLYRSGATVREITRCLKEQGIQSISCATAVKSVRYHRQC